MSIVIDLRDCALSRWTGDEGSCRWCGDPLVDVKAGVWCSLRCKTGYAVNHSWTRARRACVARDGWSCRHCGRGPALNLLLRWLLPAVTPDEWRTLGHDDPDLAARWWEWTAVDVEAHHVDPLWGQPRVGCSCHLDGLVALCDGCHKAETRRWRRVRSRLLDAFGIDIAASTTPEVSAVA